MQVNQIKLDLFGKNGLITNQFKKLDQLQSLIEKNMLQI